MRAQTEAGIDARTEAACRWLRRLETGAEGLGASLLIVVAHADDEVIGVGGQLARLRGVQLVHVTDGAPRNLFDARAAGFDIWQDYAAARREELLAALKLAGIEPAQSNQIGIADQEASFRLAEAAEALSAKFCALRSEVVMTHAYEGGHPDHDATAFAVHAACALVQRRGGAAPAIVEMTGYHMGTGQPVTCEFLHHPGVPVTTLALDDHTRTSKRRLVDCFFTQRRTLAAFLMDVERFRPAPAYQFTRAPHPGRLFYEHFDWGLDGAGWRRLAGGALAALRLADQPWA